MFYLLAVTALAAMILTKGADAEAPPDFDSARTGLYTGPVKPPDFSTNRDVYRLQTRIKEGAAKGINFAGRVAVVGIGCGTDCSIVYAVDLTTGRIYNFPLGGEENYRLTLQHRPWSRLIAAWWMRGGPQGPCMRQDFIWSPKDGFIAQGSAVPVPKPCPAVGRQ